MLHFKVPFSTLGKTREDINNDWSVRIVLVTGKDISCIIETLKRIFDVMLVVVCGAISPN